jgi:hypothetical protein
MRKPNGLEKIRGRLKNSFGRMSPFEHQNLDTNYLTTMYQDRIRIRIERMRIRNTEKNNGRTEYAKMRKDANDDWLKKEKRYPVPPACSVFLDDPTTLSDFGSSDRKRIYFEDSGHGRKLL